MTRRNIDMDRDVRILPMVQAPIALRYETTGQDPDHVRELVNATGVFTPAEVEVAVELVLERLAKGDGSGYYFVFAERDQRPIGYACYGPIACTVGSYDLFWIAVHRDCQGQGLGRMLVAETERLIRERRGRHIYIETSNRPQYAPTRGFYLHCDYREVAVFADFYAPGDDKVVYVKKLD
ncbi:MAG: GNAT family N-acetyltransferase [Pirellulaceae bacterium]